MADNALAKQVGKKMPERRKTRLEQIADEIQAYGGRVRDDFMAGAERSAQGLGDIVERGDVLTGIPRLALGGTAWMGAPVSAALSPVLSPILQPVGEAVNTYVGQPVEDLTGYPADITNDLAMTGLTLGAVKGLGMTRPYLARAADQVEGLANRAGYTLRKPANVYGSGPTLTPLVDEADNVSKIAGSQSVTKNPTDLPDLKAARAAHLRAEEVAQEMGFKPGDKSTAYTGSTYQDFIFRVGKDGRVLGPDESMHAGARYATVRIRSADHPEPPSRINNGFGADFSFEPRGKFDEQAFRDFLQRKINKITKK